MFVRNACQRYRSQVTRDARLFAATMGSHLTLIRHLELGLNDLNLFF